VSTGELSERHGYRQMKGSLLPGFCLITHASWHLPLLSCHTPFSRLGKRDSILPSPSHEKGPKDGLPETKAEDESTRLSLADKHELETKTSLFPIRACQMLASPNFDSPFKVH